MRKIVPLYSAAIVALLIVTALSACQQKPAEPRQVSVEEASRLLGVNVPVPTYLPSDYKIQEVFIWENTVTLLISDEEIDYKLEDEDLQWKVKLNMTWYSKGQVGGLKLPGEWVNIGETRGVIIERETANELWWIWPEDTNPEKPGQFEFRLSAIKGISKAELIRIAESVSQE